MSNPLAGPLARRGFLILDGGLATELEARGHDLGDALWSARLLADDPAAIRAVHDAYRAAGADCVIAASYQASFEGFEAHGRTHEEAAALLLRSIDLARGAGLVAASVGPYGAARADGSEYTGDYGAMDEEALLAWHAERFRLLAGGGADLLACETLPSLPETRALLRLLDASPATWAWFSFCCRDGAHLGDGTPVGAAAALAGAHPRVAAVGVNCTAPRHVEALLAAMRGVTDKPLLAYPNSGETWDAARRGWVGANDPEDFAEMALRWRAAGARILGGCCRTGPEHIRRMHARLAAAG